jgi:hypothetical protein
MAIAQRGTATGVYTGTSPLNLAYPAGIQAGDLIVATIQQRGGSGASITPPSGWTSKLRTNNGSSTAEETFYRNATGAESGNTAAFALAGQTNAAGQISAWSGADTTGDPTDGAAGQTGSATATITAPTITTTTAADLLIYGGGGRASAGGATTYTPDAAMSELAEADQAGGAGSVSSEQAAQTLGAAGATGTRAATASQALTYAAQLVALKALAVAPTGGTIKVWTGSAWVDKPVKVWSGSAWQTKPLKYWNGTAWVPA